MPRKAAVDIQTIFEVVKNYPVFDDVTGNSKKKNEQVWEEIKANEEALTNIKNTIFIKQFTKIQRTF